MNKKWLFIIGAIVLLGTILFMGNRAAQQNAQAQELAVGDTVRAFIGDLSASATASGQVKPAREATLSVTTPGRVLQVNNRVGDSVQTGDTLMQLDTAVLELNVANAAQNLRLKEANLADLLQPANALDIASAAAGVASAQANLDDLLIGPSPEEIAAYEANLRASEASLWSASANLATVQGSVTDSQILAAQAALASAQIQQENAQEVNADNPTEQTHQALLQANQAVADAQARLNSLLTGPSTGAAQGNVAAASARLDGAQANYNLQTNGANTAQIASAQAQLAQAEAALANLLDGPAAEEIVIAEAEVAQARLDLQDAQDALAKATLTAPFTGVVTAVNFSEGEIASGPVIKLVDISNLEVILEVDEVDIGSLAVGQPATLTLEAWPDTEIPSHIVTIAPGATTQPGSALVIYEVHLALGETSLPVRVGMTANANLITAEINDVLLVPNQAINVDRDRGTYTVNLVVGEGTQEIPVTIGLRDSQYSEITSGLNDGDELQITNGAPIGDVFGPDSN